jgi:hypothetical protein
MAASNNPSLDHFVEALAFRPRHSVATFSLREARTPFALNSMRRGRGVISDAFSVIGKKSVAASPRRVARRLNGIAMEKMMAFNAVYKAVAAKLSSSLTQQLLKVLLNVDDKLNVIEHRLAKIQYGPYLTGIDFLNQAVLERSEADRKDIIALASNKFTESGAQTDDVIKAISYFFGGCCNDLLGKSEIALYKYIQAFRAACQFELTEQIRVSQRGSVTKTINVGAAGVGAAAGGVVGLGICLLPVAVPVTALTVIGIMGGSIIAGASPLYLTTKAGEIALNLYTSKHRSEVDKVFNYFTRPLAALLIERGFEGGASGLVVDINNGVRPDRTALEHYLSVDCDAMTG